MEANNSNTQTFHRGTAGIFFFLMLINFALDIFQNRFERGPFWRNFQFELIVFSKNPFLGFEKYLSSSRSEQPTSILGETLKAESHRQLCKHRLK